MTLGHGADGWSPHASRRKADPQARALATNERILLRFVIRIAQEYSYLESHRLGSPVKRGQHDASLTQTMTP